MEARLLKLELEGFRSFKKKSAFEFPEGDSVVLIDGKWRDLPISSGSGKTSVVEGLAYLLDISTASASALKNWDSKKMIVKGVFKIGNSIVEAVRDPKLSLTIDGVPYEGLTKGAKEKLQELLGGNPEVIKSITYRKQRKPGKIVNSTDSQIKEFLTNPLGLNEVESASEVFVQQSNRISSAIELLKRDEQNIAMTLPMNTVTQEEVDRVEAAFQAATEQYNRLAAPNDGDRTLNQEAANLRAEIQKLNMLNQSINNKRNENATIKQTVLRLQSEIAHLEKNTCPTCSREWNQAQELLANKNAEIDRLIGQLRVNAEYVKNSEPMLSAGPQHEARLQEIQRLIGEASAPVQMARQTLESSTYARNSLINKINNYNSMLQRQAKIQQDLAAQERELQIVSASAKLLGRSGFMGSIFDEILNDIEVRTNDMLQHFPNASQFTVQISSTRTTKTKGTTKKEISVNISKGGVDVNLEDISGGQQSAIELCSDLAAAEAIRSRSGCSLRWICLDEVMDGLGPNEKSEVVDMIRKRVKGLVLMIEHATEIKASFDKTINIEFDGRESHVVTG